MYIYIYIYRYIHIHAYMYICISYVYIYRYMHTCIYSRAAGAANFSTEMFPAKRIQGKSFWGVPSFLKC